MPQNNRVLLAARPQGEPRLDDFRFDVQPVPEPAVGELLLQVVFVSLDPYVRGRMNGGKSYAKTLELGDVIEGRTVARVLASRKESPGRARHWSLQQPPGRWDRRSDRSRKSMAPARSASPVANKSGEP
jgi:hypothetical protein